MWSNLFLLPVVAGMARVMELAREQRDYDWTRLLYLQTFIWPAIFLAITWLGYQIYCVQQIEDSQHLDAEIVTDQTTA
jgi:hypothetical protein